MWNANAPADTTVHQFTFGLHMKYNTTYTYMHHPASTLSYKRLCQPHLPACNRPQLVIKSGQSHLTALQTYFLQTRGAVRTSQLSIVYYESRP